MEWEEKEEVRGGGAGWVAEVPNPSFLEILGSNSSHSQSSSFS